MISPGVWNKPVNDIGFSLFRFSTRGGREAVVLAQKPGKKEQQLSTHDLVAMHIADVLELRLTGFVLRRVVTDRENPEVTTYKHHRSVGKRGKT